MKIAIFMILLILTGCASQTSELLAPCDAYQNDCYNKTKINSW